MVWYVAVTAGTARTFVRAAVHNSGVVTEDAVLLTAEIVTLALGPLGAVDATITVDAQPGRVRIEISSPRATMPPAASAGVGILGLRIIDHIADDWGFLDTGSGFDVWFELLH